MPDERFFLEETTIAKIQEGLKKGTVTCRGLTEGYLRRIEAYDRRGPSLKAVLLVNPKALEEADALDRLYREKGPAGPLHGIPVLIKDNVETKDMATTSGSLSLENYLPDKDACLTKKLREAGALVLAKANMHEFAIWGESVSSILGQVLNPYDLTRTPGGSSGGTGAGIAANFAAIGIGTDTVNSIRSPASACACVGIRPTVGLVSREGIAPYSLDQDTAGPICRTVEDAAAILGVISGYDPGDPETAWSVGNRPAPYTAYLCADGLAKKRIGVLRTLFGEKKEHEEVNAAMERSLRAMADGGAVLVELDEPIDTNELTAEVSVHLHTLKDDLEGYLKKLGSKAPYNTLTKLLDSGKIHPGIVQNLKRANTLSRDSLDYRTRTMKRLELRTRVLKLMADHELDALVYPHQKGLVVPVGESQGERNGVLGSATGFPSIALPAGFSTPTETTPLGVPIGLEFLGRPWREGVLIAIAYSFEQKTRYRKPPESTPPLG